MSLYARASDLLSGDTVSVVAGTEDAEYPKANITDRLSRTVGKFTSPGGTYRRTFGVAKTAQAAVFVNTNATAIQLTNGAGLNVAVPIPATPPDGHHLDPWVDLRGLPNTSSTEWTAALSGPAGLALGEFILVETLRDLLVLWTPQPIEDDAHPAIHHETDYAVDLDYGMGVRVRRGTLTAGDVDGREALLLLQRAQRGRVRPWVLIPNAHVNDALFVTFASDGMGLVAVGGSPTTAYASVVTAALAVKEQQKGLAL